MPIFMVRCYVRAVSDGNEARKIEAKDALEAAEKVCGGPLIEGGKPGQFRAVVSPLDKPSVKKPFYVQASQISN